MKRILQWMVILMILAASLGSAADARAWSNCSNTVTVQWGDTLSGIAAMCGTTVQAIRAANPGLGWWVYAGQVLNIPTGNYVPVSQPTYGSVYTVQYGDTLGKIAARVGCSLSSILAVNPQIQNPSLIYVGQRINLPVNAKPPANPPPPPPCNCTNPPPQNDGSFSTLKISFKGGMYIRSAPNGKIISSAVSKETVYYFPSSPTVDTKGRVWVQVKLFTSVPGYSTGWLMVKDQFGTFFTDPQISAKVDP